MAAYRNHVDMVFPRQCPSFNFHLFKMIQVGMKARKSKAALIFSAVTTFDERAIAYCSMESRYIDDY